jgi:omega-amidase
MAAANRGAQVLVYPGAFNTVTGPAHWQLLSQARAVDNQLFVLTCSPARAEGASYQAWGHSTAVGAFGEIIGTTDESASTVHAELDLATIAARRRAMPLQAQRRGDVYALVDRKAAAAEGAADADAAR